MILSAVRFSSAGTAFSVNQRSMSISKPIHQSVIDFLAHQCVCPLSFKMKKIIDEENKPNIYSAYLT